MRRIREIDGLRAAAVMAVILFHWQRRYLAGGFIGVDLFFVISGYVITAGLLREDTISLRHFYMRRVFRIFPALAATLAVFSIIRIDEASNALPAALSVMNWKRALGFGSDGGIFGHAWSLSIEEQFYLLWPLCLILLLRTKRTRPVLVAAIICIALWRAALLHFTGPVRVYNGLDTHSDGLLIGCLLATMPKLSGRLWIIPAAGLLAFAYFADEENPLMLGTGLVAVNLLAAWLIGSAANAPVMLSRLLTIPPVQWVGTRSYAIYLWHYPIGMTLSQHMGGKLMTILCFALTFAAAELSFRLIEKPAQQLGRRLDHLLGAHVVDPARVGRRVRLDREIGAGRDEIGEGDRVRGAIAGEGR
jgi:peptidoglycan/LPS O-acetylase OafA/YrhL